MPGITRRHFLQGTACLAAGTALGLRPLPAMAAGSMGFNEYRRCDGLELARLVRQGEVSPAELLELAIARTEQVNPHINAVVIRHYETARRLAGEALPDGPFRGVPFLLKDLGVSMADTITTHGSRFFREARVAADDAYVRRARQAGLVIFGKTNSPEFGNSPSTEGTLFGDTRNPWNLEHSAGGSSGGAAAAVAAGILPVAHASDGGGSIRLPASSCGLFGLKPSRDLVPIGNGPGEARGLLSAQHVISRSVRDSAAMLDALAWETPGPGFGAPGQGSYLDQLQQALRRLRIAVMRKPLLEMPVDAVCLAALDQAVQLCSELGHELVEAVPEVDMRAAMQASGTLSVAGLAERVAQRETQLGRKVTADDLEPVNMEMLAWGRQLSAVDYLRAQEGLRQTSRDMTRFMEHFDLVLSPTMTWAPPPLGVVDMDLPLDQFGPVATRSSVFTVLYNITGQPAMSVPLYWSPEGLPVGVMFAGRFGAERTLLQLAGQLEQAQPWFDRLPPV
ncbi:amidase [Pseudomonas saudimassiliensis]|uniref:Amidase n=1 Tax=Pseudomonas saudimassiliensis TaxID=1461581 RepID=A0A078M525_9PSED|nr:amidase [Pseudomonas saudimassiliensis]CEA02558.1 amidase [Pseudomonas saudimassiliensis]CEF25872.1 amidase [Pseudomonas saudimassiliensis]